MLSSSSLATAARDGSANRVVCASALLSRNAPTTAMKPLDCRSASLSSLRAALLSSPRRASYAAAIDAPRRSSRTTFRLKWSWGSLSRRHSYASTGAPPPSRDASERLRLACTIRMAYRARPNTLSSSPGGGRASVAVLPDELASQRSTSTARFASIVASSSLDGTSSAEPWLASWMRANARVAFWWMLRLLADS